MMQGKRNGARRAQSTIEYLLVVVAVLLAVLFGVNTVIQPRSEARMDQAGAALDRARDELNAGLGLGGQDGGGP